MPTTTFYDNSNTGEWGEQQGSPWTTLRGTANATGTEGSTTMNIESWNNLFSYSIRRGVFSFNTSSLGAGATISAATLILTAAALGTGNGSCAFIVTYSGNIPVGTPDFKINNFGGSMGSNFGTFSNSLAIGSSGTFTGGTDFMGYINKTGTTNLGIVDANDYSNVTPTGTANAVNYAFYSNGAGTSLQAALTVTYTAGGNWLGKFLGA